MVIIYLEDKKYRNENKFTIVYIITPITNNNNNMFCISIVIHYIITALPDQCLPLNPCKNGALCIDGEDGVTYTCKCLDGFSGDRCEIRKYNI